MSRRRPPRDPATRFFVLANVAIFLLQMLIGPVLWQRVEWFFGLSEQGLVHGGIWQLLTYQFLHANELHILVNMLGLWFAGRELEPVIGTRRFVALYLVGGVVGGVVQIAFAGGPLIGASASVCAVLLALTTLFPTLPVMALIFFVLPLRMKARTLGYGMVAASVLFWLSGWQPEVGHLAHLGGFATGWIFGMIFRSSLGEEGLPEGPMAGFGTAQRMLSADDVVAKILRRGIDSLSREELRILEESRRRRRDR